MITEGCFRLPDRVEWIRSCQCDLIKKAPFHIFLYLLGYATAIVLVPVPLQVHVCVIFFVCVFLQT